MSRAIVWTLAVLLGASVLLNVGLLVREPPSPPTVVERVEVPVEVRVTEFVEVPVPALEMPSTDPPAKPQPFVTDPVVADGLDLLDSEDRLTAELDRLQEMSDRMERGQLHRAILEHVAAHLGLAEPGRSRFIAEGEAAAADLWVVDEEYDAAVKQAYLDAGRDWTKAEVSAELHERWEATKRAATARLTGHLDPRDAVHAAFLQDHLHALVWGYLSRSGFSWE